MADEAATPTGGAETSARSDVSAKPTSVHDRIKAAIFAQPGVESGTVDSDAEEGVAPNLGKPDGKQPKQAAKAEQEVDEAEEAEGEPKEAAQDEGEEARFSTVDELAEALGWDLERILDLEARTKIDGKEGRQRLRDLVKSHQLEGHLNQKLMTFADEKKAFETERQNFLQTSQQKLQQMDSALQVASRLLQGEFASVDWQKLQSESPLDFNQQYVAFQQRQGQLNYLADQIAQERKAASEQAAAEAQRYLTEQTKLLESKVPEWSSESSRKKALAEMAPVFQEAYGVTADEIGSVSDHRVLLVARDAWQWQKLQKAKPTVVNKVKNAPKLLKPGTPQTKTAQSNLQLQQDKARLKESGKVRDAKPVLKKLLFG